MAKASTVKVKIIRNTKIAGERVPAMVGQKADGTGGKPNVVTTDADTARILVNGGKAEYVAEKEKAASDG